MTTTIIKGAEWVLSAERAEGAPDAMYRVECMTCESASRWTDNDPRPVGMWALLHTQTWPDHRQFLATTQDHWRVDRVPQRAESPPGPATPAEAVRPLTAGAAPAHPWPLWSGLVRQLWRRAVAYVGRAAGPLVVLSLITGGGVLGYLLGVTSDVDLSP